MRVRANEALTDTFDDIEAAMPTDEDLERLPGNFDTVAPSTPGSPKSSGDAQTPDGVRTPSWPSTPNPVRVDGEYSSSQGAWELPSSSQGLPTFKWQPAS